MIKAQIKVSDEITLEVECRDQKELFDSIAGLQDVFQNTKCGKCGSVAKFQTRTVDANQFFEARCTNPKCRAKLSFGCHKTGNTLFPKRSDDDGKYHKFNGWKVFDREQNKEI